MYIRIVKRTVNINVLLDIFYLHLFLLLHCEIITWIYTRQLPFVNLTGQNTHKGKMNFLCNQK